MAEGPERSGRTVSVKTLNLNLNLNLNAQPSPDGATAHLPAPPPPAQQQQRQRQQHTTHNQQSTSTDLFDDAVLHLCPFKGRGSRRHQLRAPRPAYPRLGCSIRRQAILRPCAGLPALPFAWISLAAVALSWAIISAPN